MGPPPKFYILVVQFKGPGLILDECFLDLSANHSGIGRLQDSSSSNGSPTRPFLPGPPQIRLINSTPSTVRHRSILSGHESPNVSSVSL